MFVDDSSGAEIDNPDPNGGLYIVSRSSRGREIPVKVNIPKDELAIQCGECLQIVTGGLLVATVRVLLGIIRRSLFFLCCSCVSLCA
jgi:hypothetical protein